MKSKKAAIVSNAPSDQKASVREAPQSVANHKNPDIQPIGKKAMQGLKGGGK